MVNLMAGPAVRGHTGARVIFHHPLLVGLTAVHVAVFAQDFLIIVSRYITAKNAVGSMSLSAINLVGFPVTGRFGCCLAPPVTGIGRHVIDAGA